jgi:hypothetical protein
MVLRCARLTTDDLHCGSSSVRHFQDVAPVRAYDESMYLLRITSKMRIEPDASLIEAKGGEDSLIVLQRSGAFRE